MIQTRSICFLLKQVQNPFEEVILAEKSKSFFKFSVGVVYIKSKTNKVSFVEKLDPFIDEKTFSCRPLIVCGDFNIDNACSEKYKHINIDYDFESNKIKLFDTQNPADAFDIFIVYLFLFWIILILLSARKIDQECVHSTK